MEFRTLIPVRFGEVDFAQVVYFPRFLHYFHCAFEEFWESQGLPIRQMIEEEGVGLPVVHLEVDFRRPLRCGDRLEVGIVLRELGERSAKLVYQGWRHPKGELSARAEMVVACVSMQNFQGCPLPARIREALGTLVEVP